MEVRPLFLCIVRIRYGVWKVNLTLNYYDYDYDYDYYDYYHDYDYYYDYDYDDDDDYYYYYYYYDYILTLGSILAKNSHTCKRSISIASALSL